MAAERRSSRLRPVLIVALILLLLGGAAWAASGLLNTAPATATVSVARGDILSTVETNGKLEALTTAHLSFKNPGRLTRVLVNEGDSVAVGAVLAEQDTDTLDLQLRQAQTDFKIAQLKLQQAKDGPLPQELAAAQADVQSALAALAQARGGGQAQDIRASQAALDQARAKRGEVQSGVSRQQIAADEAAVREAQAGLAKARKGADPQDIAAAQADVHQAQAALDKLRQGATPQEIAAAAAGVRQAQAALDKLRQPASADDIAAAQAKLDQATANRATVSATTSNTKEQARISMGQTANALRNAEANYSTIRHNNDAAYRQRGKPVPDDAQHTEDAASRAMQDAQGSVEQAQLAYEAAKQNEIAQLAVADGSIREAQAALDKLKAGPTPQDIAAAQAAADQAQANLDKLKAGPSMQDVASAQAGVDQAQAHLNKLNAGPAAEDIASAQAGVDHAQAALDADRAGPSPDALKGAQAGVDQAQANLDKATQGATHADVAEAQSRVAAAQAALALKQQGSTPTELAILQQQVQVAQYGVDNATAALADARIVAPFAGTVLTIGAKVGETTAGPVMEIAALNTLRARADIDELDVGRVQPGQAVTVTLDAYPGVTMLGSIESLAPGATEKQGSTIYKATVVFTHTTEIQPRPGMVANLLITAERKAGVLYVPNRALETIGGKQFVTVLEGTAQRKQKVETGLSNADKTEVVDDGSLRMGQTVVLH
ncbi:MAG: efflux RND transporter periplasmic adaptor subunit [Chloroflexia bacterium]